MKLENLNFRRKYFLDDKKLWPVGDYPPVKHDRSFRLIPVLADEGTGALANANDFVF